MLFQNTSALLFIVWLIIATVVVSLVIYLAVKVIESEHKASDKKIMIVLVAFICVFVVPIILGLFGLILGAIGDGLAWLRNLVDPNDGGRDFMSNLVPIIGFIIILALIKFLIDITWESSLWVTLLTLFVMYIFYSLAPELYIVINFG